MSVFMCVWTYVYTCMWVSVCAYMSVKEIVCNGVGGCVCVSVCLSVRLFIRTLAVELVRRSVHLIYTTMRQ